LQKLNIRYTAVVLPLKRSARLPVKRGAGPKCIVCNNFEKNRSVSVKLIMPSGKKPWTPQRS